jgi:hypothetical protein
MAVKLYELTGRQPMQLGLDLRYPLAQTGNPDPGPGRLRLS